VFSSRSIPQPIAESFAERLAHLAFDHDCECLVSGARKSEDVILTCA